jgi:hypothetical protein
MRPPVRFALGAVLVVGLLVAMLAGEPVHASAESGEPGEADMITTVLQPGWNMVAWVGPEAPATAVFEAIPALRRASAWDADHQRYQRRARNSIPQHPLRTLTPGMGLWLEMGGDEPFEWTRPVTEGGALVSLRAGRNLVGWTGRDRSAVEDALARFGASLVSASRWDAQAQGYVGYRPDAAASANSLVELEPGDGLWVELTEDARWWQPGAHRVEFTFPDEVPAERQATIRDDMADVIRFFAERYGITPPEFAVTVDFSLDIFGGVLAREILIGRAAVDYPYLGDTLAHEYFHLLQRRLGGYPPAANDPSPRWMTEGAATYAGGLYRHERWGTAAEELRLNRLRHSHAVTEQLDDLTLSRLFYAGAGPVYSLAALAVEWLSGHAAAASPDAFDPTPPGWSNDLPDNATYVAYYEALSAHDDWKGAFASTFGLLPGEFYESFEAYRSALATSRLPHLDDDDDTPMLVFLGAVDEETQVAAHAAFDRIQAFFGERFGAGPADYTVFAAAEAEAVTEAYTRALGSDAGEGTCSRAAFGIATVVVIDLRCGVSASHDLHRYHYDHVRDRLAPWSSLPAIEGGGDRRGPEWLRLAARSYTQYAYDAAVGDMALDEIQAREVSIARRVALPLASLVLAADVSSVGFQQSRALAFLAGEWLAERAGEPALFDYLRQLPTSDGWEAAFEAAFGMSVEDFHEAFEAYRAEVAPPLPHLADDSDEPVLVLVGEMTPETREAVRARFSRVQDFFRERFEAGTADYTVYVGADPDALAEVHLRTTGRALPEDLCGTGKAGVYSIVTRACIESSPAVLARDHYLALRAQLAPSGSLPPAPEGHALRGPLWLLLAIESYALHAYGVETGAPVPDTIRDDRLHTARRLSQPLSALAAWPEVNAAGFWTVRTFRASSAIPPATLRPGHG